MEGTLAEIRMFAGNFNPLGWDFCNGQPISVAANPALYSLLGTTYGGDGVQTFALPNFSSRVAIGTGQGPGLSNYNLGQTGGFENNSISISNMPMHNHSYVGGMKASSLPGTSAAPSANANTLAAFVFSEATVNLYNNQAPNITLNTGGSAGGGVTGSTGSNFPVPNIQPYLSMNYIICSEGIFPQRN